jgi:membrane-associated phospholipid phosphatase
MSSTRNTATMYGHAVKLYPFDWLIVGYSSLMIIFITLLGRPLSVYYDEIAFYASMVALVVLIARFVDEHRGPLFALIRIAYPVLLFTFFYRATGGLMFLVFNQFYDWQLTSFEKALFGVNPTLYIDKHWLNAWTNEIFSFCYFSYYFMIPVFVLVLFVKKNYQTIKSFLTAACLTFFLSYLLFFLYPIEGPRWHFAGQYLNRMESPLFSGLVDVIIDKGAVRGGCMPSSHFGVALVILLYCFRYYRKAGWLLLPINLGLAIGTVWGRFHYVSDVVAGGLLGLASVLVVWNYYPRWSRSTVTHFDRKELKAEHAS